MENDVASSGISLYRNDDAIFFAVFHFAIFLRNFRNGKRVAKRDTHVGISERNKNPRLCSFSRAM